MRTKTLVKIVTCNSVMCCLDDVLCRQKHWLRVLRVTLSCFAWMTFCADKNTGLYFVFIPWLIQIFPKVKNLSIVRCLHALISEMQLQYPWITERWVNRYRLPGNRFYHCPVLAGYRPPDNRFYNGPV